MTESESLFLLSVQETAGSNISKMKIIFFIVSQSYIKGESMAIDLCGHYIYATFVAA
jgi:hypothetical protein